MVILIIGILFALLYNYYPRAQEVQIRQAETSNTEYIDNAIVGFAYSHGRLPLPDTNNDGIEDAGATRGTIPEVTLGMAEKPINKSNIPLVYSVFRRANTTIPKNDADLGVSRDRLPALLPSGVRNAEEILLNQSNTIDFCFALRTAANIPLYDNNSLYVSKTVPTDFNKNVAYVLVDAGSQDANGDGDVLDGFNTAGLKFEVGTKAHSPIYDDKVNTMEFAELFGALACGSTISAALHAHDNAVLAADMMATSFVDYQNLLDLTEQLAEADVALGAAAVLQALAGDGDVIAAGATALAESLTPPFTAIGVPAMVEIAISAVIAIAATAAAAATVIEAAIALDSINDATDCFESGTNCEVGNGNFVANAQALTILIRQHAVDADAAGL